MNCQYLLQWHSAKNFRYSKASTVTAAKRHIKGTEFSCLCYLTINKESFRQFKFRVTRYLPSILHKFFSKRPLQKGHKIEYFDLNTTSGNSEAADLFWAQGTLPWDIFEHFLTWFHVNDKSRS